MDATKTCSKCKKSYPSTQEYFNKRTTSKDGLNSWCKECVAKSGKEFRKKNGEKIKVCMREYYVKNRNKMLLQKKIYYQSHKTEIESWHKLYREKNREKLRINAKSYRKDNQKEIVSKRKVYYKKHMGKLKVIRKLYCQKNKKIISVKGKAYYLKNKKMINARNRSHYRKHKTKIAAQNRLYRRTHRLQKNENERERKRNDLEYRLRCNLSSKLSTTLAHLGVRKSDSTMALIGCDVKHLVRYIESRFDKKMTWDNYGRKGWHIDHIKPCVAFDLIKPEEQRKCFNYKNLQPLWWPDNLSKSSFYKGKLIRKNKLAA